MEIWLRIQMYFQENWMEYANCVGQHLGISFLSFIIAALIGIPFGCLCAQSRKAEQYVVGFFQILRIIPSLAILILLIPIMGVGVKPAMTALVFLAIPPILMNTTAGLLDVPDFMLETAKGLGMTDQQIFWKVKIPQALPMILAGMKTALVEIIASAAIAAKIGAGGLGGLILTGLSLNRTDLLLVGGISVAALSLLTGRIFHQVEHRLLRYKYIEEKG